MVIISILDSCANRFSNPVIETNLQTAKRSFRNAIIDAQNNPESLFYTNPGDFQLFMLGEFDSDSGYIDAVEPQLIYSGSQVMNEIQIAKLGEIDE